ncbi:MAG: Penicillin-binding protein, 1A family [Parcubacteria group bacterium GW2011_GWE2_38_18]|nr:MAG: Penicillin-binding protein, 1A family [Parcubacteria group bacterium GW2011_GWE2_38_18]
MPIPQLSHRRKTEPAWANNKKYFVANKPGGNNKGDKKTPFYKKFLNLKFLMKTAGVGLILLLLLFILASRGLPDPNKLMDRQVAQSTKIYDRTGKTVLYEIAGEQKRTLVTLNEIPVNVRNATVAIEDKDFYNHGAFSLWAIFRTVVTNVVFGKKAGGSTLTQQFVKNAILTNEKTYTRKAKELILAYRLEQKFSKDEVLQLYLNEIPYGATAYGVEAASQRFFGKSVRDVNLAEAAILASIPQAPSRYSPYGPNKDLLIKRQQYVLDQMAAQGYVTTDEAAEAKNTELVFKKPSDQMLAPHFVMYIKEILGEKYGEKTIEQDGLKIITTLDLEKQKIAEEVVAEKTTNNEKKYQATNAALVSIDPKTGQILAMVGSKNFYDENIDGQVNIATSPRQPGSSFKPMVYAASFIKGFTPETILYDVVTNFSTDASKKYEPHNYDNNEHGPITIRKALAGSLNIPAVKAMYLAGIDNVLSLANKLGYTTLKDKDRFGLSLVLGGGEVSLLEHANAYTAFANEGSIHPLSPILRIEDRNGKTLEEYEKKEEKVFDPQVTRQITSILSDNNARSYVFGARNFLTLSDRPVAAKTGTTNDYKDAWTMGFTPSIVTGVWVGNSNNDSMKRGADGSVVAAPIWHDYMQKVLKDTPVESFKAPEPVSTNKAVLNGTATGTEMIKIDKASNLLATEYTPASFVIEKNFSQPHSILYYVNKDDPRGPAPKNPSDDPQFNLWEGAVNVWAKKKNLLATTTPPTESDNLHKPENNPIFTIDQPANNQIIIDPTLTVRISASAPRGVGRAEYYIDNNLIASVSTYPFALEKNISFLPNGYHDLLVKVYDDIDNSSEQKISINLNLSESAQNTPPTISWLEPETNSTISIKNFPYQFKFATTNTENISKINLYYKTSDKNVLISNFAPTSLEFTLYNWQSPPPPGNYTVFAEAKSWSGEIIKSEERNITIQ